MKLKNSQYLGQCLQKQEFDGIICSKIAYPAKVFEGWHAHENDHISLILQGGNKETRKNGETAVTPGAVLFYGSGEWHMNSDTHAASLNFNVEITPGFRRRYQLTKPFSGLPVYSPDTRLALLKLFAECRINDGHSAASAHTILIHLLDSPAGGENSGYSPSWAARCRQLLHDRWNENLSLREIAAELGIHPVTLSKSFPRCFSCSLGDYIRKIKIDKAIIDIRTTRKSLTTIAARCGFFDQSHFIRTFRHYTGLRPGEFRKIG